MHRVLLALLLFVGAIAAEGLELTAELQTVPDPAARAAEIEGTIRERFDAALNEFDAGLKRHPHDIVAALSRCRFIQEFAGTYEYASFSQALYESAEECFTTLEERSPEHPEIVLAKLDRTYGDERLQAALDALADSQGWTGGQLSRLHVVLATAAEAADDARSFGFAQRALQLDESADVRLMLATEWVNRGNKAETVRVLTSPVDDKRSDDVWYQASKMRLLADVGARDAVVQVYGVLRDQEAFDAIGAAGALRKVGAIEEARDAFSRIPPDAADAALVARERFHFELQHGDPVQALVAYNSWRDQGWSADPLAINRFALFVRAPALDWHARDLLGVGGALMALVGLIVLTAVPISVVHYWGLARRARITAPYPRGDWGLRHAWSALFLFFLAQVIALYTVGPLDINALEGRAWGWDATAEQVARLTVIAEFVVVLLFLPLAMQARRLQPLWWSSQWSPVASLGAGVLLALVFRVPLLLTIALQDGDASTPTGQPLLWQVLDSVRQMYGVATALWLVVIAAPVFEEFIFRGILLRAFAKHIRFAWANVIQAALFALVHFDLRAAPMLFAFGLALGFLAQRSGGLLGPMTCHLVFNLILALVVLL